MSVNGVGDALGGTMYWGASLEAQAPFSFLAQGCRPQRCDIRRRRLALELQGPTSWSVTGETLTPGADSGAIRASVGVGLIWNSPFGPLRFDYSFPLAKQSYDQVQAFRFGGATKI